MYLLDSPSSYWCLVTREWSIITVDNYPITEDLHFFELFLHFFQDINILEQAQFDSTTLLHDLHALLSTSKSCSCETSAVSGGRRGRPTATSPIWWKAYCMLLGLDLGAEEIHRIRLREHVVFFFFFPTYNTYYIYITYILHIYYIYILHIYYIYITYIHITY